MITGTIYIRVTHPIEAKHIEIEVKGQEKVKWTEHLQRRHEHEGRVEMQNYTEKRKGKREIMHYSSPVFVF